MEAANDSILFGMPEDPEMFLAALAVVQDYVKQLVKQTKERRKSGGWFVAAHVPDEMNFLRMCFPAEVVFVDEWNPMRGEWDYVYKFDAEAAYRLSLPTGQHVTTAFGVMVGADPAKVPDVSGAWSRDTRGPLLSLLDFEGREELSDIVSNHYPELTEAVCGTQITIGRRSFATYLASALGQTVIELYPDDRHPKWLEKPGNYQMIYGDHFPVEYIWRALEGVLDRWPIQTTM